MNNDKNFQWGNLFKNWDRIKEKHLKDMFTESPNRFEKFSFSKDDLTLDFSKERIDEDILKNLIELAKSSDIEKARTAMFSGEHINNTENRAVMHVALRANAEDNYSIDGILTSTIVHDVLDSFLDFADNIRSGNIRNARGETFTDVINIGIGFRTSHVC